MIHNPLVWLKKKFGFPKRSLLSSLRDWLRGGYQILCPIKNVHLLTVTLSV